MGPWKKYYLIGVRWRAVDARLVRGCAFGLRAALRMVVRAVGARLRGWRAVGARLARSWRAVGARLVFVSGALT